MPLTDGKLVDFDCTNCRAKLFSYWETRETNTKWKLKAENCPWCDESPKTKGLGGSRTKEVMASGHVTPAVFASRDGEADGEVPSTLVDAYSPNNDEVIILTIQKASKDAKPVR